MIATMPLHRSASLTSLALMLGATGCAGRARPTPENGTVDAAASTAAPVVISELMFEPQRSEPRERFDGRNYGPYLEVDDDPALEYVEIFNRGDEGVALAGWAFDDGVDYVFPPDARIEARGYLVIAADPEEFGRYHQTVALGPFQGRLSNSGERVQLVDALGVVADHVDYGTTPPWPALPGAGGAALERVAVDDRRTTVENWRSSAQTLAPPLVGTGTPGKENSFAAPAPPPAVVALLHTPSAPAAGDPVTVTARVLTAEPLDAVELELTHAGPTAVAPTRVPMVDDGTHGDGAAGDGVFGAVVPGAAGGTLTHYRVVVQTPAGASTYPYDDEPSPTRAFYVHADAADVGRFHLFIEAGDVELLREAALASPRENPEADATLVSDGIAYPHIHVSLGGRHQRAAEPFAWKIRFNPDAPHDELTSLHFTAILPQEQHALFLAFARVGLPSLASSVVDLVVTTGGVEGPATPYLVYEAPNGRWADKYGFAEETEVYKARSVESSSPRRNSDLFYFGDEGDERADNGLQTDANYWGAYGKVLRSLDRPVHIAALVAALSDLPDDQLLPWLDANIDVDTWLLSIALHVYLRIDDFAGHNYYLLLPGGSGGKWQPLSYDFDSFARFAPLPAFYASGLPGESADWQRNKLHARIAANATLSRIYLLTLRDLVDTWPPEALVPSEMVAPVAEARIALLAELDAAQLPSLADVPVVDPCGGAASEVTVSAGPGTDAWVTLDGSDPRLSPTRRLADDVPLTIVGTTTVRAAGAVAGRALSDGRWTDAIRCDFVTP